MLTEGSIQVGESRIPFTWASSNKLPTFPTEPNYDNNSISHYKVGMVLPEKAHVYLFETASGWGGFTRNYLFLKAIT